MEKPPSGKQSYAEFENSETIPPEVLDAAERMAHVVENILGYSFTPSIENLNAIITLDSNFDSSAFSEIFDYETFPTVMVDYDANNNVITISSMRLQ